MVLENAGAGTGRHVLDLCKGLSERGWRVHVALSEGRLEPAFQDELGAIPDVQTVRIPMRRSPGPWDALAAFRLARYLRTRGPFGVVHGHSSKGGALVRLVGKVSRARVFYTPHALVTLDPNLTPFKRRLFTTVERGLSRLTDRLICVSADEFDHAAAIGLRVEALRIVPNGIRSLPPASRAQVRQKLGLCAAHRCVGFVGRLGHQKAVDTLLRALVPVVRALPSTRLVIVGDGPDRPMLEALARELRIAPAVTFTGQANGAEMMAAFDLFVLPSLYEGFPYVLLEAAARGLPIVMTAVGGAAEMRAHAGARVVAPADSRALSQALLTGLNDAVWLEQASAQAQAASAYFSVQRMVDDIEGLYLEAIGGSKVPAASRPSNTRFRP